MRGGPLIDLNDYSADGGVMNDENYANRHNPYGAVKEQGYGYLLVNSLTGKVSRILTEYDEDIEEMTKTYEIHIFWWTEKVESSVSWG